MKLKRMHFGRGFRIALTNSRAQAAEMVIAPGESEGGPDNSHRGTDQWLYVVSGSGSATIDGRRHTLKAGTLLLIERKEKHEIKNTGRTLLRTLNFYVPPGYTDSSDERPAAKS